MREHDPEGAFQHERTQPEIRPAPDDNTIKDPADWTTGDEPMTGAQAGYLKTLSEQAHAPEEFSEDLSKAEAGRRIDGLREKLGRE